MTTSPIPVAPRAVHPPAGPLPFPWIGLIALSATVFLSISSEMIPTGLLPEMSESLGVSPSQVGLLVTVFAFTVVISSAPLTAMTVKVPRHTMMVAILAVLGLSNLLTAIAPTHELVLATRILGGLAHGLFWAMVPAYAAHLVDRDHIARAVSITLAGGTIALVLGVPLGTVLGQAAGWRWAFAAIAFALFLGVLAVIRWLPPVERDKAVHADAVSRRDPTILAVALLCVTVAIVMIGNYAFYTYIAPYLIDRLGVAPEFLSAVLFAIGAAGALGLILAGTVFGRRTSTGLMIGLIATAVGAGVAAVATPVLWVSLAGIVLWGLAFGLVPPLLQTRLLHSASTRIRDTASAFYTTAFNIGIGGGALIGALLLDWRGLAALPVATIVLVLLGLVVVLVTLRVSARQSSPKAHR
ncbi:MFS transporter [Mycetocola miduiensis]|uniref:Predicted arabinose efflux permease, MFS family n=1 Tax=Mycetocola miduiensis TaxID=995034 RepID=A0A1I5D789_9MICO|nr:MFS transporter [Mycetocola miduiensis]SFN95134.1 Predicted arabinose efflux permease, MFS family [Mycetocola miduiensis]